MPIADRPAAAVRLTARLRPSRWGMPLIAVVLAILGGAVTNAIVRRSDSIREAQLTIATVQAQINFLVGVPYQADQISSGSSVALLIARSQTEIDGELARAQRSDPSSDFAAAGNALNGYFAALGGELRLVTRGLPARAYLLDPIAVRDEAEATADLTRAGAADRRRAAAAVTDATIGSAAVIALLLAAFLFFYVRASAARELNAALLTRARHEALTDALTGLGNRRALFAALQSRDGPGGANAPLTVVLLDLDGFKAFNDSFGHPAGDALLVRLSARLRAAVTPAGQAFRMGGDEFCVLAPIGEHDAWRYARRVAESMAEQTEDYAISCSYGLAAIDAGDLDTEAALGLADRRLYEHKRRPERGLRRPVAAQPTVIC